MPPICTYSRACTISVLSWNELEKAPEFMGLLFFAQGYHKTSSFRHSPAVNEPGYWRPFAMYLPSSS
jgi:hypothetical protein